MEILLNMEDNDLKEVCKEWGIITIEENIVINDEINIVNLEQSNVEDDEVNFEEITMNQEVTEFTTGNWKHPAQM